MMPDITTNKWGEKVIACPGCGIEFDCLLQYLEHIWRTGHGQKEA